MRVGLVIYGGLEQISGGYLYDRKLVEYLRACGDHVEVLSLPGRSYAAHLFDNLSPRLPERLQGHDILLQDELNHPSLFWLNQRVNFGCPVVSIVHHLRSSEQRPAWQNAAYRLVERAYLASVDAFVFNSQTTQDVVEGLIGGGRPSVVAYPAGDQFTFAHVSSGTRAHAPGPLRLLFVGSLIPRKGLLTLLQAVSLLPQGTCTLTVVGRVDVDLLHTYHAQQAAPTDRVTFTGPLSDEALRQAYLQAHVLVVPSTYEGFGIVYLEGMAAGLPAIGTTAGAAPEIITDGVDGFLIQPEDAHLLAQHIQELAQNRQKLVEMGQAALQRYTVHPTWGQSMERIRQFLSELL